MSLNEFLIEKLLPNFDVFKDEIRFYHTNNSSIKFETSIETLQSYLFDEYNPYLAMQHNASAFTSDYIKLYNVDDKMYYISWFDFINKIEEVDKRRVKIENFLTDTGGILNNEM